MVTFSEHSEKMLAIEYKNERSIKKRQLDHLEQNIYIHTMSCMLFEIVSFRIYDSHICGGSLIAKNYVLTAAHCVKKYLDRVYHMGVAMGHSRVYDRQVIHSVSSVLVHPGYQDASEIANDIAILKLGSPAKVNNITVSIIPLATEPPAAGELCTVTGWGAIQEPEIGESPKMVNQLRAVVLPIVNPKTCVKISGVSDSFICAGGIEGGKDSCQAEEITKTNLELPVPLTESVEKLEFHGGTNSELSLLKEENYPSNALMYHNEANETLQRLLVQISEAKQVLKFAELLVLPSEDQDRRRSRYKRRLNAVPSTESCVSSVSTQTNYYQEEDKDTRPLEEKPPSEGKDSYERMVEVHCNGWVFTSNFDSGNLGKVEAVLPTGAAKNSCGSSESISEVPDFEFNVWTRPDCAGTEFENGNRTWFYFGMRGGQPFSSVRINIVNLNKQCKMYAQGMTPVYRILPGRPQWERIKEKPSFNMEDKQFIVSFMFRFGDTINQTVYFAFTYPYTYSDLLNHLSSVESQLKSNCYKDNSVEPKQDDIYYHRELLTYTLESRRVDLITISSHHGVTKIREARIPNLFPDENMSRPFKFLPQKKVIFLSARVHPGETPSSFVMAGMINFLLSREDPIAFALRRHFVFKLIPMLNPDGVFRGNYRTDTRGVNLNRVYGNPSLHLHPSIYGARAMIRYYHHGFVVPEDEYFDKVVEERISGLSLSKSQNSSLNGSESTSFRTSIGSDKALVSLDVDFNACDNFNKLMMSSDESGLFLYIDMHGHTSKKGIFMYGNHFENMNMKVECMLFPKLITLYSQHFLFDSCNFTEKNMYVRDRRDGSSREGCGRVAVYKATGLVRSYTLECNYNTGKNLNILPPPYREPMERRSQANLIVPPKYNPSIYEEAGKSVLSALLDLVGMHPNTRLVNSAYRSLATVREVLRKRLIMEELSEKEEAIEKRRFSGKITARKMRVNKETRSRIVGRAGESSRAGRRANLTQEASNGIPSRKPSEKKKKKKLRDEGPSSSRRRIEKKCGAESSRRLPLEHRRKKLKPK